MGGGVVEQARDKGDGCERTREFGSAAAREKKLKLGRECDLLTGFKEKGCIGYMALWPLF